MVMGHELTHAFDDQGEFHSRSYLIHCTQCGRDGVFIVNWDDY